MGGTGSAQWAVFGLTIAALYLLMAAPGFLFLRSLGVRALALVALSPVVGAGLLGLVGTASGFSGLPWTPVQPLLLILVLAGFAYFRRHRPAWPLSSGGAAAPPSTSAVLWVALAGVVLFLAFTLRLFVVHAGDPAAVALFGDASYHLQATQLMVDLKDSNPVGPFGALYDPLDPPAIYYPNLWHTLVSLPAGVVGAPMSSNAMVMVAGGLIWPSGVALLGHTMRPTALLVPFVTSLLGLLLIIYPTIVLVGFAIYPFALGVAFLPGAMSVTLGCADLSSTVRGVVLVSVSIALILAQPSSWLLYCVVLVALGVAKGAAEVRTLWREGRRSIALLLGLGAPTLAAALLLVLLQSRYVQSLGRFERPSLGYRDALRVLTDGAGSTSTPWDFWWVFVAGAALGGIVAVFSPRGRVFVLSALGFTALYVIAAGPENQLRVLAGPFYKDYQRLVIPVVMSMVVLTAVAIGAFIEGLLSRSSQRWRAGAHVAFVVLLSAAAGFLYTSQHRLLPHLNRDYYELAYYPFPDMTIFLDEAEWAILQGLDGFSLPPGTRIIGLPASGVVFSSLASDVEPYLPIGTPYSDAQRYLAHNFAFLNEDPAVCDILLEAGVRLFLEVPPEGDVDSLAQVFGGYLDVETSEGFELLVENEHARLWRITACE